MKIGIDARSIHSLSKTRGIGFYAQYLYQALRDDHQDVVQVESEELLKGLDVLHFPTFDFFRKNLKVISGIKNVITVHDVIPLMYPKHYPPGIRGKINYFLQMQELKKVDAIITQSEVAKREIIKYLKVSEKKVHAINLAPAPHFKKIKDGSFLNKMRTKYNLPVKFVLFTGSVNWNKNILNVAQAALDAQVDVVFVGASFEHTDNLDHPELRSFKEFLEKYKDNPLVHILGFLESKDLVGVMNWASALLLPSYEEGFGLPILEAQICEVPVITSNRSSMVEVAGEGAVLVDPESVGEISGAIKKLIEDSKFSEGLVKKGLENVSKYSWDKVAKETVEVYKKVI